MVPDAYIHTAAAAVTHILATHVPCVSTLQIIQHMSIFYTYHQLWQGLPASMVSI